MRSLLFGALILLCSARAYGTETETIYVLHRGLHTGIIVRYQDVRASLWPEKSAYRDARYLEVGWGDTQGYRYPWTTPAVLEALFHSKGSVLLVHAFNGPIANEYAGIAKQIVAVQVSRPGFDRLCAVIRQTYYLGAGREPVRLPSDYQSEDFYKATGHYSILNTCNNWTARALLAAGCPVCPRYSFTAGIVMRQARRFGRVIPLSHFHSQRRNATRRCSTRAAMCACCSHSPPA